MNKSNKEIIINAKEQNKQVVELCRRLVQLSSYSGEEKEVADEIKTFAKLNNFDEVITDNFGNVMLVMNGNVDGPTILFDGHIDTVTVQEENWSVPPFSGEVRDGKIYGRGTSDMKGAVSAMITAAVHFVKQNNGNFPGKVVVSCSVHEECFEGVATRSISDRIMPDYVVIGEATNLNLNHGQRGRAEIVVETIGKSVHSSNPEKGINAVTQMMKLLNKINQLNIPKDEILGKGILELTDIISNPYPGSSVVPSNCRVTYDRRLLVGETRESVLKPILNLIKELEQTDKDFDAKVYYSSGKEKCYTGTTIEAERFFPGWLYSKEETFVTKTFDSLKELNPDIELSHYSFCTNGSHFAGEKGIPTIGFGPSQENMAHIDDEFITLEQLEKATEGYKIIMNTLSQL